MTLACRGPFSKGGRSATVERHSTPTPSGARKGRRQRSGANPDADTCCRRTLRGVPGSLTRRQLLIRPAARPSRSSASARCPAGAVGRPGRAELGRAATYAAVLDAINADPALRARRRERSCAGFAEHLRRGDESLRAYADAVARRSDAPARRSPSSAACDALARCDERSSRRPPRGASVRGARGLPHHRLHGLRHEHLLAQVHRHRPDRGHHAGPDRRQRLPRTSLSSRGGRRCARPRAGCGCGRTGRRCSACRRTPGYGAGGSPFAGRARRQVEAALRRRHEDHPDALSLPRWANGTLGHSRGTAGQLDSSSLGSRGAAFAVPRVAGGHGAARPTIQGVRVPDAARRASARTAEWGRLRRMALGALRRSARGVRGRQRAERAVVAAAQTRSTPTTSTRAGAPLARRS